MSSRSSPLHAIHDSLGGSFTEFGGWTMPVVYDSIKAEHRAVRESAGKFDVSHMGEIEVTGPDAERLMNRLTTNDVSALDPGEGQYSAITDEDGILLDDTVVYRRTDEDFLFIPNAGHDEEMYNRWTDHRDRWGLDASVRNSTADYAMIAVQGPDAIDTMSRISEESIRSLGRFELTSASVADVECLVSRSGYTGEDGVELIFPWDDAISVWESISGTPCGLGARDTLRMEAGLLLSGQDFHPEKNPRTPYEAGIGFTVKLESEFVGRDALERVEIEGVEEKFVGLMLIDPGVPRHGYRITDPDGTEIGEVTSGTMSPTLDEAIGLGYVPVEYASPETRVHVVIRDQPKKAKIKPTRFIDA